MVWKLYRKHIDRIGFVTGRVALCGEELGEPPHVPDCAIVS